MGLKWLMLGSNGELWFQRWTSGCNATGLVRQYHGPTNLIDSACGISEKMLLDLNSYVHSTVTPLEWVKTWKGINYYRIYELNRIEIIRIFYTQALHFYVINVTATLHILNTKRNVFFKVHIIKQYTFTHNRNFIFGRCIRPTCFSMNTWQYRQEYGQMDGLKCG